MRFYVHLTISRDFKLSGARSVASFFFSSPFDASRARFHDGDVSTLRTAAALLAPVARRSSVRGKCQQRHGRKRASEAGENVLETWGIQESERFLLKKNLLFIYLYRRTLLHKDNILVARSMLFSQYIAQWLNIHRDSLLKEEIVISKKFSPLCLFAKVEILGTYCTLFLKFRVALKKVSSGIMEGLSSFCDFSSEAIGFSRLLILKWEDSNIDIFCFKVKWNLMTIWVDALQRVWRRTETCVTREGLRIDSPLKIPVLYCATKIATEERPWTRGCGTIARPGILMNARISWLPSWERLQTKYSNLTTARIIPKFSVLRTFSINFECPIINPRRTLWGRQRP